MTTHRSLHARLSLSLLALVLAVAGGSAACQRPVEEHPTVALSFPYARTPLVDSELLVDVVVEGCESGYRGIDLLQGTMLVATFAAPQAGGGSRLTLPLEKINFHGLGYPAEVTLTARIACAAAGAPPATAESPPASISVIPGRRRHGDSGVRWPGYSFLVEEGGTLLFCGSDNFLVRTDLEGREIGRSTVAAHCSSSTTMSPIGSSIVVLEGTAVWVLTSDLRLLWRRSSDMALSLSRGTLLATSTGMDEHLTVSALDLTTGREQWTADLSGSGLGAFVTPPVAGTDGMVHVLSLFGCDSPEGATGLAWVIDPAHPEAPVATPAGVYPAHAGPGRTSLVIPRGILLGAGGETAVVATWILDDRGTVQPDRLMVYDLLEKRVRWSNVLASTPSFIVQGDDLLVLALEQLWHIDAAGELVSTYAAPAGTSLREVVAHQARGGVLLRTVDASQPASPAASGMAFLGADLTPAWLVPYPWAFGAAISDSGVPHFLNGSAMIELFDAAGYVALTR